MIARILKCNLKTLLCVCAPNKGRDIIIYNHIHVSLPKHTKIHVYLVFKIGEKSATRLYRNGRSQNFERSLGALLIDRGIVAIDMPKLQYTQT